LNFQLSNTDCSQNSPLHITKTRPHREETSTIDQPLHHVQTKETNYKIFFLRLNHVSSKHELALSYTVTVLTLGVDVLKTPVSFSSHLRDFLSEPSNLPRHPSSLLSAQFTSCVAFCQVMNLLFSTY
jgi:hypothetical protein